MQEEHKRAIQANFISLLDRTDLKKMVSALYEKGVFSEHMLEYYANESISPVDRKRHLYRAITRRGPDAFDKLTEALMEMGHWDLVRDLDPNSPLHRRPSRPELRPSFVFRPREETDENNFVSLKNKKQEAQKRRSPPLLNSQTWPSAVEMAVSVAPPPPAKPLVGSEDAIDLSQDIPNFHVKKSTRFFEEDESKGVRLYATRGRARGALLLLSFVRFAAGTDEFRHGVQLDTDNLKYLFSEMGFKVLTYMNLTLAETRDTLRSLESVLAGVEVVFTVVSSHGYAQPQNPHTSIRCSDGRLITDGDIIEFFNHRNMPALHGVPKVFIFQVCRGGDEDFVYLGPLAVPRPARVRVDTGAAPLSPPPQPPPPTPPAPPSPPPPPADPRPLYSDTLVVHSTLPGFVSHRDKLDGSWYIQVLCEVFAESAHDCHVDKLFKLVDERLQNKYSIQTSSVDSRGFNKKLYLHPGLYE